MGQLAHIRLDDDSLRALDGLAAVTYLQVGVDIFASGCYIAWLEESRPITYGMGVPPGGTAHSLPIRPKEA